MEISSFPQVRGRYRICLGTRNAQSGVRVKRGLTSAACRERRDRALRRIENQSSSGSVDVLF